MTDAPVQPGEVLAGKYRVDRILGAGNMGVVVQATHEQLEQRVALKFLLPEAMRDQNVLGRFMREARLAVKLRSEHVAKVLDVGTLATGAPYIVMEYLNGEDLNARIERDGPLSVADAAELVIQACDGIAEAHALGIVHRDLKPANLFMTRRPDGTPLVKVLDFGISKPSQLDEGGHGLTQSGSVMGSPHYMSPEQMISSKDVDTRSDVWAVGVILFQLLTARVPFDAETLGGLMSRVLTEGPPSLAAARPEVPQPICEVVAWCLQKNRDQRAPNVAAVATALAPFAHPRSLPIADRIATLLGAAPLDLAAMSPRANSAPPAAAPPLGGSQPGARGSVPSGPEPSLDGSQPNVAAPPSFAASQPALSRSQVTSVSPPPRKGGPLLAVAVGGVVLLAAGAFGIRQWRASRAPVAAADSTAPTTTAPAVTAPIVVPGVVAGATASAAATAPATATIAATTSATATPEPSTAVAVTTKKGGPARTAVAPPPGPPPTPPPPPVPTVRKSVLDDRN